MACSAALFGDTFGAADFARTALVAAVFAGVVFATVGFAAALVVGVAFVAVVFAAVAFTAGDLTAVVFADEVAFLLGALDAAGLPGVGIGGVDSPELLVAIRTL